MDEALFEKLCHLYEVDLRLLRNPSCDGCDARIRHPLTVWHVGREYSTSAHRILFIGKPHRGKPGTVRPSGLIDPRALVEDTLRSKRWPYWSYTVEIARLIHGSAEAGWNRIAMTNVIKCTNVDKGESAVDTTSLSMVRKCAIELDVISAEIRILRPTNLILYAANFYPHLIKALRLGASSPWRDVVHTQKHCGRKLLPWRERVAEASWGGPLRLLVTGHPERMHRGDYTQLVSEWVLLSNRDDP